MVKQVLSSIVLIAVSLTISHTLYCSNFPLQFKPVDPDDDRAVELEKHFNSFEVFSSDLSTMADSLKKGPEKTAIRLELGEKMVFEIDLQPAGLIADNYLLQLAATERTQEERSGRIFKAFKGQLLNRRGGEVRLTIDNDFIYGYIQDGEDRWFIEPLRFFTGKSNDQFVFYHVDEVVENFDNTHCASMDLEVNQQRLIQSIWKKKRENPQESRSAGECYQLDLAIASDWSMYAEYNQNATELENRNIGVMNNVQGNYEGEFDDDIEFNIVTQYISTCSTCDPWTSSTDAGALLGDFRNWGNDGGFGVSFGLGQLWTDRNFNGLTIGVAYLSGVCNNWNYHVLQNFSSNANFLRVLTAHEIGHNFNASHDASGSDFIMAPSVNSSNNWSSDSKNDINNYIDFKSTQSGCFEDCGSASPPSAEFFVSNDLLCPGSETHFYSIDKNAISWSWSFFGGNPSFSTEPHPTVEYSSPGIYDVSLTVSNASGSDSYTMFGAVEVSEFGGFEPLLYDDFEEGLDDWIVSNPDNGLTWVPTTVSHMPHGEFGIGISNFSYTNRGQEDAIISQEMDFTNREEIFLELEYAYRRKNSLRRDELNIYLSFDGGQTFPEKVFEGMENGNGNFATAPDLNVFFIPESNEEWCVDGSFGNSCLNIDLSDYANEPSVVLKIENVTDNGNNMFINRVGVYGLCQITIPPIVEFEATPNTGCAPLEVQFEDLSDNFPESWDWFFPGGTPTYSFDQNPLIVYEEGGFYDVTLTAANAAGGSIVTEFIFVIVDEEPTGEFTFESDFLTVEFESLDEGATDYFWSFGDGNNSSEKDPVHQYDEGGIYEVTLDVTNICGTVSYSEFVEVSGAPIAAFEISDSVACAPVELQFTNTSLGTPTSFSWFFPGATPDQSSDENPLVVYDSSGVYNVTFIAENADGNDTVQMDSIVIIYDIPIADFDYEIDNRNVEFTSQVEMVDSLLWLFGDGDSSSIENPVHEYEEDGDYDIVLFAFNRCGVDTLFYELNISTPPEALFTVEDSIGCAPFTVQFSNESSSNTDSVKWYFPGGEPSESSDTNPQVSYSETGLFDVELIAFSAGGTDTIVLHNAIEVNGPPIIDISYSVSERTVVFENLSSHADSFKWNMGDGFISGAEDIEHTYEEEGVYDVELEAYNQCDTSVWMVTVSAFNLPASNFLVDGESEIEKKCLSTPIQFEDFSSGVVENRSWIFEGGIPETSQDSIVEVVYEEAGVYSVVLITENLAGSDTLVMENLVEILGSPEADFSFEVNEFEVEFSAQVENADSFIWDFGDGNIDTLMETMHEYKDIGLFEVRLIAWNQCDTVITHAEIGVGGFPQSDFVAAVIEGCEPFTVDFENLASNNTESVEWTFEGGMPATSTEPNPTVIYEEAGIYSVSLTVENSLGNNTMVKEEYISVLPMPVSGFDFEQIEEDGLFQFLNNSLDGENFHWSFGDGNFSTEIDPIHRYEEPGTFEVILAADNVCGSDSTHKEVEFSGVATIDLADLGFLFYPNPTSGSLFVEYPSEFGEIDFSVINILGEKILDGQFKADQNRGEIDFRGQASGSYFLILTINNKPHHFNFQLIGN